MSATIVTVMCPNLSCRSLLRVPEKVRGRKVRCGECGTVFTVPAKAQPTTSGKPAKKG